MSDFPECRKFTSDEIEIKFSKAINLTLGEVDVNNTFRNKLHKGIAGVIVEQSILGYPANSEQGHDILLDGKPTEVKTTGLRRRDNQLYAKEPVSITAVSIDRIGKEDFFHSHFWDKVQQILFVYYLYDSDKKAEYSDYADFPILDYQIFRGDRRAVELMKNDWECIQKFIVMLQTDYEDPESQYPRLSHELRSVLVVLDTAPKYPNNPRFRFKRAYVDYIVQKHFSETKEEYLQIKMDRYADLDAECERLSKLYGRRTVGDIAEELGTSCDSKNASEQLIVRMFGGKSKKLAKIEQFVECSVFCKSVVLSCTGKRTEDCKFYTVDFEEMLSPDITDFTDSVLYDFFANHQFVIALLREPYNKCSFSENMFLGFQRITMPEEVIDEAYRCWSDLRETYSSGNLKETILMKDGEPIINKCGTIRTSVNFPKSKNYLVFMRGTAQNSKGKTVTIGNIKVYPTQIWIKGSYIVEQIHNSPFMKNFNGDCKQK